jgi:uncharacterized membrane protein (UPF0127 family)
MKRILAVLTIAVVVLGIFLWHSKAASEVVPIAANQQHVRLGDTTIGVDIADTPALREQGLSGKQSLDDAHGMLFIFQDDGKHAFWMKDMLFSIDMIWLSADKKVIYIAPNAAPDSYPSSFSSDASSSYVIEVPAGWATRHRVSIGSTAQF